MTPSQNNNEAENTSGQTKKVPYHFGEKLRQVREHKGYTSRLLHSRPE